MLLTFFVLSDVLAVPMQIYHPRFCRRFICKTFPFVFFLVSLGIRAKQIQSRPANNDAVHDRLAFRVDCNPAGGIFCQPVGKF